MYKSILLRITISIDTDASDIIMYLELLLNRVMYDFYWENTRVVY